jgi:hypothetical protein
MGLLQLWSLITLWEDLKLRCSLKQSCSSSQELFNNMWHAFYSQVNWVDSRLFVVGNQIGNLTPDPSIGHNLCFKCPNEQCKPILNIYVPRAFQWYKECHEPLSLDPWNFSLRFRDSIGTPSPKVGIVLGCEGSLLHTPSHFLTLPGMCDVILGLFLPLIPRLLLPWLPSFLLACNLVTRLPWSRAQS